MQPQLLPRYKIWCRQYRLNRYCAHLSKNELNQRIRDIFINMLLLQSGGKIGVPPIEGDGPYWFEMWTHVLEELSIRYGPYPAGFTSEILNSEPIPNLVGELAKRAASSLLNYSNDSVFIKFGKRKYMEELFSRGALRIHGANYYSNPDHNGAVRDDELALCYSVRLTKEDIRKLVANSEAVPSNAQPQRFDIGFSSKADYWLYCLSAKPKSRLFVDFEADSCVVIFDKDKFSSLLRNSFAAKIPKALAREGDIEYVDPLFLNRNEVDLPFSKHFRFRYQEEFRFVWLSPTPAVALPHIDIELGPLQEIASLITL